MNSQFVTNWGGDIRSKPAVIVHAKSAEEIAVVMKDHDAYPSPVRAEGSNHSTTECTVADGGTLVNMRQMDRVLAIDAAAGTVTVEAGALIIDVAKELERHRLQFYVNCEIGNITMGSAATCGTKDSSMPDEYGQVNSYVVAMKLVRPDGALVEIGEDDPELLRAARSSYGLFGIIYEVTFRVRPLLAMRVQHETYKIANFLDQLPMLWERGQAMMFYISPFIDRVTVEYRNYEGPAPHRPKRRVWRFRNFMWKTVGPAYSGFLTRTVSSKRLRFALIDTFNRVAHSTLSLFVRQQDSIPPDQMIRYAPKAGRSKYTFSIWAFPEETYATTLSDYVEFVKRHYETTGYRCDLLDVGYRVLQDQSSLFSYSFNGNMMTADPVSTGSAGWDEFLDAYNVFCSEHHGIPLFNQSKRLTRTQIDAAFGERIAEFQRYRARFDPGERLVNPFFRQALL